ncbi:TatD-related deoxyribonuclease, partial [Enterobacter ludwigii]
MIFDTHAHYDDEAFDEDREELLASLFNHGIEAVTNVGASMDTSRHTLELAEKYPYIYGAIGVHPNETGELNEEDLAWLKKHSAHKKVVAIGEIGLDYY